MEPKTVIRIEHTSDGIGMFSSRWPPDGLEEVGIYQLSQFRSLTKRHDKFKSPSEDGLDMEKDEKDWFCSFKSIEQIQQWLEPKEFIDLSKIGYRVLMLDIDEYQEGEHQVVYTKESIVSQKDITSLFL